MIYEQRTLGNERVDTIRITLDTPPDLIAQYAQGEYTEVMEHYLVLYKPPEAIILQDKLDTIATALPDEIAAEHVDLYPAWSAEMNLSAGDRVRYTDALYRVQQEHTTQSDWTPDTAASLFTRINAPGDIPAWAQGSYAEGAKVTHNSKTWMSMVPNNVWEPGAAGIGPSIWKEEV